MIPRAALGVRRNLVPGAYRGVAVSTVDCPLDEASLTRHFLGREAYRRTRFIVVRRANGPDREAAIIAVDKQSVGPLFAPITSVELLAAASECAYLELLDVDTAVPSALTHAALEHAPGVRGVIVQGRYGHVSFVIDPAPLRITVREVAPPYPPKLFDQARRLVDVAENLHPVELVSDVLELDQLAHIRPSADYLLPCRGGGVTVAGANNAYLDERPPHADWTLIGCERSQQIHEWFYGDAAEQVDICPRKRPAADGAVLLKCCLLEQHIEVGADGQVVVPWGASLEQISEALTALVSHWEPTWAPV